MSWLRLYTDLMDDAKVMQLGGSHFKSWVLCLCISKLNFGRLPVLNELAFALRLRKDVCEQHLKVLFDAGLLELEDGVYKPHNWDSRQFVSDDVNARVKAFRERKRNVTGNVSSIVTGNAHETEMKPLARAQSTEYRVQKEETPLAGCKEKPPDAVKVTKRFKAPTPAEAREYSASIGFDLDGEKFCDHYAAKGWVVGKSPMKNWQAAVRTWRSREHSTPVNGHKRPETFEERMNRELDELAAKGNANAH